MIHAGALLRRLAGEHALVGGDGMWVEERSQPASWGPIGLILGA